MSLGNSTKLRAMVLAWENVQEVYFVILVVGVVFISLEVFHFIAFRRHPSTFREVFPGFYNFACLNYKTINFSIASMSHEVES